MRSALLVVSLLAHVSAAFGAGSLAVEATTAVAGIGGLPLADITGPVALDRSAVVVRGTTTALLAERGGTLVTLLRGGDALPAPLAGRFSGFGDLALNDSGAVAFVATLDSAAAKRGLFLAEGGAVVPIVLAGGEQASGGAIVEPDLNAGGDVVFRRAASLYLWGHGTTAPAVIARVGDPSPSGGAFRRILAAALNDAGVIAFAAEIRGPTRVAVFVEPAGGSPAEVWTGRRTGRRMRVAINTRGQVAFVADRGVYLYDPAAGAVTTVAPAGSVSSTRSLEGYVGIDAAGTVAFVSRRRDLVRAANGELSTIVRMSAGASGLVPRLTPSGATAWVARGQVERPRDGKVVALVVAPEATPLGPGVAAAGPSINGRDEVAFTVQRAALYEVLGGAARALIATGETVAGVGQLRSIDSYASGGGSLVLRGNDVEGRDLVATDAGGRFEKVVAENDPSPLGGAYESISGSAVGRGGVLFEAASGGATPVEAVYRVGGSRVEALVKSGDRLAGGRIASITRLETAGSMPLVEAQVEGRRTRSVLLRVRGRALAGVVRTGARAPGTGGGRFGTFTEVVGDGPRTAFAATIEGGRVTDGLFAVAGRRTRLLVAAGTKAPGGGTFTSGGQPLAVAGERVVFSGTVALPGGDVSGLFIARRRGPIESIVTIGAATPAGGTIAALDAAAAIVGERVVFAAELDGPASAHRALLAWDPGR